MRKLIYPFCIALVLLSWGCSGSHDKHGHSDGEEAEAHKEHDEHEAEGHDHKGIVVFTHKQAEAGGVVVDEVKMSDFAGVIRCSGEVLAAQGDERTVSSPVAGVVSFAGAPLTPGAAVSAGQRLFNVSAKGIVQNDPSPEMKANLSNAQVALKRTKELFEQKMITKAEYDQAVADVNAARAALANPGAYPVRSGSASAPISGFVAECLVRPGDYVEIGSPLAVVSTNRRLQLRADVPQKYSRLLSRVAGANIVLPYNPDEPLSLAALNYRMVSYGKGSASGSLYIPVTMEFNNPGGMAAGSPAEVYLLTDTRNSALTVPRSALTEEEGLYFVYVEEQPEHFRKQQVQTGQSDGVNVEILSGLKQGERIVTKGATLLKLAANSGKAPQGHTHNH